MSYSIYIGNGEMKPIEEYTTEYSRVIDGRVVYFDVEVDSVQLPDAPTFPNDEMTGNSNARHPGYSAWGEFCRITGLYDLFFNRRHGLMCEHPGFQLLEQRHAQMIELALHKWQYQHPTAVPGFDPFIMDGEPECTEYDPILARLIWLDWWVKWALKHCENAGVYNC